MSTENVWQQIRRLLEEGHEPAAVTEQIMADLPRRWKDFARPFVLRCVRTAEGQVVNRRMRQALGPFVGPAATGKQAARRQAAVDRLRHTVYRMPDGTRVLWDDMTVAQIDLKIAQLRKQIGSLVDHLHILEAARKLCADHGVTRLGEIDGWQQMVTDIAAASTDIEHASGGAARGQQNWDNTPDVADGVDDAEQAA